MEENNKKNEEQNTPRPSEGQSLHGGTVPPSPAEDANNEYEDNDEMTYISEDGGTDGSTRFTTGEKDARDKLKKIIERLKREKEEYLDGWQRERASFANFRKEQDKRASEFREMAAEDIILEVLSVLDNVALAEKHAPEDLQKTPWYKGIIGIEKQLRQLLARYHVEEIEARGKQFDPSLHEAIAEEESDKDSGMIVEELQKGYRMGERIIRPAKVKIAK